MNDDNMNNELSTNDTKQLYTKRWSEKQPFGRYNVNGKIILKCTYKTWNGTV